jgi:hypothetical protein
VPAYHRRSHQRVCSTSCLALRDACWYAISRSFISEGSRAFRSLLATSSVFSQYLVFADL